MQQRWHDALIERQVLAFRHQASVRADINRFLEQLDKAIAGAIASIGVNDVTREVYRQQRLAKLLEQVADEIKARYREITIYHVGEMAGFAEIEAAHLVKRANDLLGGELVALSAVGGGWAGFVKEALISGAVLAEWWEAQSEEMRRAFDREMRIGILNGETDAQLVKRVRGTREMGFRNGIMEVSRRRAKILVRGASSAVSRAMAEKFTEDNPEVFTGVQQISVFDGRTSDICIAYGGKVWTIPDYKPVGHSLPYNGGTPRHPNCRSQIVSVLHDRYGSVQGDGDFKGFLDRKPKAFVDALLGKGKADLYRAGKITLNDLVDQNGRALTLKDLGALT